MSFDGATFDAARDGERLASQLDRVKQLMADGEWRTLSQIVGAVGGTEASVSARLRDFRKHKFGGHDVQRRHVVRGLFQYRLVPQHVARQGVLFGG